MRLKPFVYLSESLVTNRNNIKIIIDCARDHGYDPDPHLLRELWGQAALGTRGQLQKYDFYAKGFKQQALSGWYTHLVEQIYPAILSPGASATSDGDLARDVCKRLMDPRSYSINEETHEFIHMLESNGILWGIIANDDHLYPLSLKSLGLRPFKLVSARTHVFKPLPQIFEHAWSKVPSASQHDVWFIGDSLAPYDNITSRRMRVALHTHGKIFDDSNSQHMRIKSYDDILKPLGLADVLDKCDFTEFDMGADQLAEFLELPKNELLGKGERDLGLIDIPISKARTK